MSNNNFDDFKDQFVLSHELIKLMNWIVRYNPEGLRKIIETTIKKSKKYNALKRDDKERDFNNQELQNSIIEFFNLMEYCIDEYSDEDCSQKIIEKDLLPTIDLIDSNLLDDYTLNSSLAEATNKFTKSTSIPKAKQIFYKELLKQWNPEKEEN